MTKWHYPKLGIYTKKQLANSIFGRGLSFTEALDLIEECQRNKDSYWFDNIGESKPEEGKWVRTANGTPLGQLQRRINNLLAQHDDELPPIIYGGLSEKSAKDAANALLGHKKHRTLLKIDMRRFFEHISYDDVVETLTIGCACSKGIAEIIAGVACVSEGAKNKNNDSNMVVARGFSTSSRLAVWCNLDLFRTIFNLANKKLKGHDPRIAIYMDDIGITASRVSPAVMAALHKAILEIVEESERNLEINRSKTIIIDYLGRAYNPSDSTLKEGKLLPFEFLGLRMERNRLYVGQKTRSRVMSLRRKTNPTQKERRSLKGLRNYMHYISKKKF